MARNATIRPVAPGLWQVPLGFVNAFVHASSREEGLTLIDTGVAGSATRILDAVRSLGHAPGDIRRIVVTHCHSDHAGSLAELKRLTGATALMHPLDASLVRQGLALRPLTPAPGFVNALIVRFLVPSAPTEVEPAEIEVEVTDGQVLPGGLRVVHVPGHCAGQIALVDPRQGGCLIAADAAAHAFGLALSPLYEDLALGVASLRKLSALAFEAACFGHGSPIATGASWAFRRCWPAASEAAA